VPDTVSDPEKISERALQLRPRERNQIAMNFNAGNYELASTYVWTRSMALLKSRLASLGNEFIGELLQRPDIDEFSDISTAVSDSEAISLARDLGVLNPLQTMRLLHSQAVVAHFAGAETSPDADPDEVMTKEEAISCLRICVQAVLGHERIEAAENFKRFREKLETETLTQDSPEILNLRASPYFFVRTAVSIILSLFRKARGAQLEHVVRNAMLIIPEFWPQLKSPERWQIGQTYAFEFNAGHKESVKGLHSVLLAVKGFDFVSENLRSSTFAKVAASVIAAHQGLNNFYNEPAPMRELASLGTSIPGPALAACITAVLCVKLGNFYGVSRAAQTAADHVIQGISNDRWIYYLDGRLEEDLVILPKLLDEQPRSNWMSLMRGVHIDPQKITSRDTKELITATNAGQDAKVRAIADRMYRRAVGLQPLN
jgi:hypothetical protein